MILVYVVTGLDVVLLGALQTGSVPLALHVEGLASPVTVCVTAWVSAEAWELREVLWRAQSVNTTRPSDALVVTGIEETQTQSLQMITPLGKQIISRLLSTAHRWALVSFCISEAEKGQLRLCWQLTADPLNCLDSVPLSEPISLVEYLLETSNPSLLVDVRLFVGTAAELVGFNELSLQCWDSQPCLSAQLTSSLVPQQLSPLKLSMNQAYSTLAVSGWFFLTTTEHTHIASLANDDCQVCGEDFLCGSNCVSIGLYLTSDAMLQACLSFANFHHCLEPITAFIRKWSYISLSYRHFELEICSGTLWEAAARCAYKTLQLDRHQQLTSVFLALGGKCQEALDVRVSPGQVLSQDEANQALEAQESKCVKSCFITTFSSTCLPFPRLLGEPRQLAITHFSAITWRSYMTSGSNNYYTFVNNHSATVYISFIADNLGGGGDPDIYIYKSWNGNINAFDWKNTDWLTSQYTLYPPGKNGIKGLYTFRVYAWNGPFTYEARVRIACSAASLSSCSCPGGSYPNPYTTSCAACGNNACQVYASLGCLPYSSNTNAPGAFNCQTCWAAGTTLNLSSGNCVNCNAVCASCSGTGVSQCVTCKSGATLAGVIGSSTCVCVPGYFPNSTAANCALCASTCLTCNGSAGTTCTSCKTNAELSAGSPSACRCVNGYGGTAGNCQPCHATCLTCQLTASNSCKTCYAHAALAGASPNSCVCQAGYFPDITSANCSLCDITCLTCASGTSTSCTGCKSNAYRVVTASPSACTCVDGYHGTPNACLPCDPTCSKCSDGGVSDCTACKTNAEFLPPAVAGPAACKCSSGFFPSPTAALCAACHPTCLTCNSGAASKCTTCKSNASLPPAASEGSCSCVLHYFPNTSSANCVVCDSSCYSCVGAASNKCSACYLYATLLNGINPNSCVCDSGYAPTPTVSTCQVCDSSCKTCSTGFVNGCTSCYKYATLSGSPSGTCDCIPGTYFDLTAARCLKCHQHCLTCSGSAGTQCLMCAPGETMNGDGSCTCATLGCPVCFSTCLTCSGVGPGWCQSCESWWQLTPMPAPTFCECGTSYFPTGPTSCGSCYVRCEDCVAGGANDCVSCFPNALLSGGVAPNACECIAAFYFPLGSGVCQPCHGSCASCYDGTASECLSCFTNAQLSAGSRSACICLSNYYPNTTTASCACCDDTCLTCLDGTDDDCLTCHSPAARSTPAALASSCICPTGFFPNPDVTLCTACHSSCVECSGTSLTDCLSCFSYADLVNGVSPGQCICNTNAFPSPLVSSCALCNAACLTCTLGTVAGCSTCHSHAHLASGPPGACTCDSTYLPMPGVNNCQQCDATCLTCSAPGASNCMSCLTHAQLIAAPGPSACKCSFGYYAAPTEANCALCFPSCKQCSGPGEFECLVCYADASPVGSIPTNCECDAGFYRDPGDATKCNTCEASCLTCSAGAAADCTDCYPLALLAGSAPSSCTCAGSYFPFPDASNCIVCHQTCQSCVGNGPLMCSSCYHDATLVGAGPAGECACDPSFFPDPDASQCSACDPSCLLCMGGGLSDCTQCFAPAVVLGVPCGVCECPDGKYPAPTAASCGSCHSTCRKCVDTGELDCTGCYSNAALESGFKVFMCRCDVGFFPDTTAANCQPCDLTCMECVGRQVVECTSCLSFAQLIATVDSVGYCECQDGAFPAPDASVCTPCDSACLNCVASGPNACSSCAPSAYLAGLSPTHCLCKDGFFPNPTAVDCQPCNKTCATCIEASDCLTCRSHAQLSGVMCECKEGYTPFPDASNCLSCPQGCRSCSGSYCERCFPAYFYYQGSCLTSCPQGFQPSFYDTCESVIPPTPTLTVTRENNLVVEFDRAMSLYDLKVTDVSVSVTDPDSHDVPLMWSPPTMDGNQTLLLNLTFFTTYLSPGAEATLTFLDLSLFIDYRGVQLTIGSLTCQLNSFGLPPSNTSAFDTPEAVGTQKAVTGAAAGAITMSILNGNPGMLTSFVNNMQLMSYIGMTNIRLTSDFAGTLAALNIGFVMATPFSSFVDTEDHRQTPPQYISDYGIESLQFVKNTYSMLGSAALVLLSYLPIYLLSKLNIGSVSPYFAAQLPSLRWNTPTRLWLTAYLDLGVYSFLQLSNASNALGTKGDLASLVGAGLFAALTLATPVWVMVFVFRHREELLGRRDVEFNQKWGALVGEFAANRGLSPLLYYYFFTIRRALFFLSLTLTADYPRFIAIFNSFLSASSLAYLSLYRPFALRLDQVNSIFNEASVLLVYLSVACFSFDLGKDTAVWLGAVGTWIARTAIFTNFALAVYKTVELVVEVIKAYAKGVRGRVNNGALSKRTVF